MCDSITAKIMLGGQLLGGVMKASAAKKAGGAARSAAQAQSFQSVQAGFNEQQSLFAQAEASEFRAETARANMSIAQRLSDDAIERGRFEEHKTRIGTAQFMGRQRVALAANGIVVDEGSALNLIQDTAGIGELEALIVRSNSMREAQGFLDQKFNFLREAELHDMTAEDLYEAGDLAYAAGMSAAVSYNEAGERAKAAGKAAAAGILLETGLSVATKWSTMGPTSSGPGPTTEPSFQPINTGGGGVVTRGGD